VTPRPAADDVPAAARFFLALSDPTRLALLDELRSGERAVGELVSALGCPQPKVSRHLKVLREAGLVHDHRSGRNVRYALAPAAEWPEEARVWMERLGGGGGAAARRPAHVRHRRRRGEGEGAPGAPAAPAVPKPTPAPVVTPGPELEDYLL
jgi:DNA-binding transcriptional ArsR family regulator